MQRINKMIDDYNVLGRIEMEHLTKNEAVIVDMSVKCFLFYEKKNKAKERTGHLIKIPCTFHTFLPSLLYAVIFKFNRNGLTDFNTAFSVITT